MRRVSRDRQEVGTDGLGSGNIRIKGARHPCLEVQDDIFFVPNDHDMNKGESPYPIYGTDVD
jgi:DNA mismatch repair ATPase MutS